MSNSENQFPRTNNLPVQSPLFWVEQKDRYLRQLLIQDIETLTKRRLVVYFANRYENAQIDGRDPAYFLELFRDVQDAPVDLLIETNGGQTDATEGVISILENHRKNLRVIVAHAAKSNGTLLCLAADSIVMGPGSELGPIEPLINGIPCSILVSKEVAQSNFALSKAGEYALKQSRTLAEKLLESGMMAGEKKDRITDTVSKLSSRDQYFSHGSVIHAREATELGLKVAAMPQGDSMWERIWLLRCMLDHDCRRARYLKIFEGRSISTAIGIPPAPPPQK